MGFAKIFTLRVEVNFCINVLCISYFYARCLLYHNVALPYKAFKFKIQKNIDSLLPLQHGGRSSDAIPGAREESVSLNPPGMANVGLHS